MKNGRIDFSEMIYIDESANKLLWKSRVKPETVLLSMSGTIGDVAIASPSLSYPLNSNQDIAKIHTQGKINPYYLYSFLRSKYGQNYLKREARGSVQQHVFLSQMEQFEIPYQSETFVLSIEQVINNADSCFDNSNKYFLQSEDILLQELSLKGLEPPTENVSIKNIKESFLQSGRLDAEYYQPKYNDVENKIYNYSNGYDDINNICQLKDKNYKPDDEKVYQYVELSDLDKTGNIISCSKQIGSELPSRARRVIKTGDVIVSSIEGSINKTAIVSEQYDNSLCSTGFYVLKSHKVNSETLLILFKNKYFQSLLIKRCSGTILTAINKKELFEIPIPIVKPLIQDQIKDKINKSFLLKAESKFLLEVAKKAVEIAIDQNEEVALQYIEENTSLGINQWQN